MHKSPKKYFLIFSVLIFSFTLESFSQPQLWKRERHHLLFGLGSSGFMGDLGGADRIGSQGIRDFNFAAVRPAATVGYRYLLLENLALATTFSFAYVSGDDRHTNEIYRNNRNIHFRSPIIEVAPKLQYYFYNFQREGARHRRVTRAGTRRALDMSFYAFGGIAGFYFNPQGYFEAENYINWGRGTIPVSELPSDGWYNLQPLRTEGQGFFRTREKYSRISVAIPFGLGALLNVNRNISVGLELGFRKTFTDYIDDVSTTYVDPGLFHEIFDDPAMIALAEYFSNPTNGNLGDLVTSPGQQRGSPYGTDTYFFTLITLHYRLGQTGAIRSPRQFWGR